MTAPILPDFVYNVKKKLGCIFIENHNSDSLELKRGQTIGLVTSCIVMQAEKVNYQRSSRKIHKTSQDGVMTRTLVEVVLVERMWRKQVGKQAVYS